MSAGGTGANRHGGVGASAEPKGRILGGRYELERRLGTAPQSPWWIARDLTTEKRVAVKLFRHLSQASADARARYGREAKTWAQLGTPHVARCLDADFQTEQPYLVCKLIDGEDLARRLARRGRIGLEDVATVTAHGTKALARAHERGLLHRDLKPSNVVFTRRGSIEIVKLVDFGVGKADRPRPRLDRTDTNAALGGHLYVSPEQLRGTERLDGRSDLWSFAAVLYEAVTGQVPFGGSTVADVLSRMFTEPLARPSALCPTLPEELDEFFAKALRVVPDQRFQSASEFGDTLLRLMDRVGARPGRRRVTAPQARPAKRGEEEPTRELRPAPIIDDPTSFDETPEFSPAPAPTWPPPPPPPLPEAVDLDPGDESPTLMRRRDDDEAAPWRVPYRTPLPAAGQAPTPFASAAGKARDDRLRRASAGPGQPRARAADPRPAPTAGAPRPYDDDRTEIMFQGPPKRATSPYAPDPPPRPAAAPARAAPTPTSPFPPPAYAPATAPARAGHDSGLYAATPVVGDAPAPAARKSAGVRPIVLGTAAGSAALCVVFIAIVLRVLLPPDGAAVIAPPGTITAAPGAPLGGEPLPALAPPAEPPPAPVAPPTLTADAPAPAAPLPVDAEPPGAPGTTAPSATAAPSAVPAAGPAPAPGPRPRPKRRDLGY